MKKILCIGNVTNDIIVSPADTIPTPGTLRSVDSITSHVGGCAANTAMDLAKLGAPVMLCCKVGNDSFGTFVYNEIKNSGVDVRGVTVEKGISTTVSVVCVSSSGERSFMYLPGSSALFTEDDIPESLIEEADIVFVTGVMLNTAFDGAQSANVLKKAKAMGKYTAMDTAWDFEDIWLPKVQPALPYLDLFMPSLDEAAKLTGETDPHKIADKLFAMGPKSVIIKLGKDGALLCPTFNERFIMPTYSQIKPVDTTGAGDAFCAGFLCGLAQGWDFKSCAAFANAVGTHCVMEKGATTGIRSIAEILEFMRGHSLL